MARFLHTADWQIGRRYGRFEADDAAALSEARYQAIDTLATLAREQRVDAVLARSDVGRLETMKRMLFDAATRHQILLLSCHPQRWHDLGVAARELPGMKAAQPASAPD